MNIEEHLIGFSKPIPTTGNVPLQNFYTDLLKNRILELEQYLSEKNAITDFLTSQLINKT